MPCQAHMHYNNNGRSGVCTEYRRQRRHGENCVYVNHKAQEENVACAPRQANMALQVRPRNGSVWIEYKVLTSGIYTQRLYRLASIPPAYHNPHEGSVARAENVTTRDNACAKTSNNQEGKLVGWGRQCAGAAVRGRRRHGALTAPPRMQARATRAQRRAAARFSRRRKNKPVTTNSFCYMKGTYIGSRCRRCVEEQSRTVWFRLSRHIPQKFCSRGENGVVYRYVGNKRD